jgi:hypothetical protein
MRLADGEPTMEAIVTALRETRRGAGWVPPFTVVGGQPGDKQVPGTAPRSGEAGGAAAARNATTDLTDIADLRDGEIERLLAENAHLNERVMFLLKVIERVQARNAELAVGHAAIETDRSATFHDFRAVLEAELRPVLLVLLRLIEKQRADPVARGVDRISREGERPTMEAAAHYDADGIVDLDASCV